MSDQQTTDRTAELFSEVDRLTAESEKMHERLKMASSQAVRAHMALTGLKLLVGEAREAGFVQARNESNVQFIGRGFRELVARCRS